MNRSRGMESRMEYNFFSCKPNGSNFCEKSKLDIAYAFLDRQAVHKVFERFGNLMEKRILRHSGVQMHIIIYVL